MSISGKTLVFTGTLSLQRAEAKKMAEEAGAKVTAAVSGNTDILVAGSGAGSKISAAEAKGVTVWTEEQFVAACSGKGKKTKATTKSKAEPAPKKARTTGRKKKDEEDEEEEEEEEESPKPAPKKGRAAKKSKKEEEEEEEEEAPKPAPKKGRGKKAKEESEEEATPKAAPKKARGKKAKEESEEEEEEEAAPQEEKAQSAGPKKGGGGFPVDSFVPGKASYKVHENFAVKLNQTNIGGNNNKYYIIQLLENGGTYAVWTRWGRVGEPGQNKLDHKGSNLAAAIKGFEAKFREKTKNDWSNKANFVKHADKYELVEVEEGEEGGADDVPLGKLSKPQIEKGQVVLKQIESAINAGKKGNALHDLSSKFFSLIPTNFGRKRPEPIVSLDVLHAKEALLEFYLRMGFEDMKEEKGMAPIAGVMDLPVPPTLKDAAKTICADDDIVRCVKKGHELAEKQVGKPKRTCSGELYASILLYTSNAIYAALNKALRDENRGAVKKYFTYLRLFLEAFEVLPQQSGKLWRGIGVDLFDQYKVGSTITWWSVSSCTSDESVARGFAAGCGGNCTMITLQAKTACDISQITFYAHEKESLLAPGTQLKILDSKRVGKVTEILVEEVGRCLK